MDLYWGKRLAVRQEQLGDKTLADIQKRLAIYYKNASLNIEREAATLYDKLIAESLTGEIRPNDLYRFNRFYDLQAAINQQLRELGLQEERLDSTKFKELYDAINEYTPSAIPDSYKKPVFTVLNPNRAEAVINGVWCADGKYWSERLWGRMGALQDVLEKGLVDSIVRGVPKAELVKNLRAGFGVGYYEAERLARTELTHVQNEAAADSYIDAGITNYKYSAAKDRRTSQVCRELNGKIFPFTEKATGINFPPMHPNCRSTIIPIVS